MIEDIDPRILAPLTAGQIMLHCFDGSDWSRFFNGIRGCSVETWARAYHIYLQSVAWKKKSRARRTIDNDRCATPMCFRTDALHVHHTTYDRIGDENVETDLLTLCERCHAAEHDKPPGDARVHNPLR